jgi:hypothetical protein
MLSQIEWWLANEMSEVRCGMLEVGISDAVDRTRVGGAAPGVRASNF